jgi:hypothetical protein
MASGLHSRPQERGRIRKTCFFILQTLCRVSNCPATCARSGNFCGQRSPYSSFAVIVIFAFSTFDTGHPFSAASAHF